MRTLVTVIWLTMMIITYVTLQSFVQMFNVMEFLTASMDSAYSLSANSAEQGISDEDITALRALTGVEHVRTAIQATQPYDIAAHSAWARQNGYDNNNNESLKAAFLYQVNHSFEAIGYDDTTLQLMLDKLGSKAPSLQEMRNKPLALIWDSEVNRRESSRCGGKPDRIRQSGDRRRHCGRYRHPLALYPTRDLLAYA